MKERITITLDKELLSWLDKKVSNKVFANRSHGFEFLISAKIGKYPGKSDFESSFSVIQNEGTNNNNP
ncbi:MAG TPA: ribbon-helix-helix domain-containing protein [Candidatus Nanoarchaeia archaeon]|nr:ribbon-helix-helix domain-containing protein [Candidatus Nanoarchaeia archaeon]